MKEYNKPKKDDDLKERVELGKNIIKLSKIIGALLAGIVASYVFWWLITFIYIFVFCPFLGDTCKFSGFFGR